MTDKPNDRPPVPPPQRWRELDDGSETHPVDLLIRRLFPQPHVRAEIPRLQEAIVQLLPRGHGKLVIELSDTYQQMHQVQRILAYDLGFADGLQVGRQEALAVQGDPDVLALTESIHRSVTAASLGPRGSALALTRVLWSILFDSHTPPADEEADKSTPPF
ncbi:MAG: hypothetical protein RBU30_16015 [Polyangia bacterium]|jgi:hypothetical protein|nr:hypothetical protein [Polyangia bacterium]